MAVKKISTKEWLKLGLPESTMTITPFYEWDHKKKDFKKPKLMVTREIKKRSKEDK